MKESLHFLGNVIHEGVLLIPKSIINVISIMALGEDFIINLTCLSKPEFLICSLIIARFLESCKGK
jgi:hypothetical protein